MSSGFGKGWGFMLRESWEVKEPGLPGGLTDQTGRRTERLTPSRR